MAHTKYYNFKSKGVAAIPVVIVIVLLAAGGIGAWIYFGNGDSDSPYLQTVEVGENPESGDTEIDIMNNPSIGTLGTEFPSSCSEFNDVVASITPPESDDIVQNSQGFTPDQSKLEVVTLIEDCLQKDGWANIESYGTEPSDFQGIISANKEKLEFVGQIVGTDGPGMSVNMSVSFSPYR